MGSREEGIEFCGADLRLGVVWGFVCVLVLLFPLLLELIKQKWSFYLGVLEVNYLLF